MDIIALVGPGSCGKTTTLNLVYDMLLQHGGVSTNKKVEGNPVQNDFSDIVIWQGKKVAFFTMGDYSGCLVNAIRDYSAQNCDKLVCACNTRFKRPFNEFARHRTTIINKIAAVPNNVQTRTTDNQKQAYGIFGII